MKPLLALAAAAACALVAGSAVAQYPSKPVRLIVPFPAGGLADIIARVVAAPLSQSLGQAVLVENRAGADGQIAALETRKAAPDGYTLFFGTNSSMVHVPLVRANPPYDPVTDFTPVSFAGTFTFLLFVHSSLRVTSVEALIDYARANPNKLSYGSANVTSYLATVQLLGHTKTEMVHVPYKGEAQAVPDFAAGRFQVMFATPTAALPLVKEGRLHALGALLPERSPLVPDLPTMAELGFPQVSLTAWAGFFAPAKLPSEVTERLSRDLNAVLARADVREQVGRHGFVMRGSSPEALSEFLKKELEAWARAAQIAKLPRE